MPPKQTKNNAQAAPSSRSASRTKTKKMPSPVRVGTSSKAGSGRGKASRNQRAAKPTPQSSARKAPRQEGRASESVLTSTIKSDLTGVALGIVALVLLVSVLTTSDAPVTAWLSHSLHLLCGLGCYLIPLALLVCAATFFVRTPRVHPMRATLGLFLSATMLISLVAAYTPGASVDQSVLFYDDYLLSRGGYIGSGVAWVLLRYTGIAVTTILLVGFLIIGLVILGLSITGLLERLATHIEQLRRFTFTETPSAQEGYDERERPYEARDVSEKTSVRKPRHTIPFMGMFAKHGEDDWPGDSEDLLEDEQRMPGKDYVGARAKTQKTQLLTPVVESAPTDVQTHPAPRASKPVKKPLIATAAPRATEGFELPALSILTCENQTFTVSRAQRSALDKMAQRLQESLRTFGLESQVVGWTAGPTVTTFKVSPGKGERLNKITNLEDDIALTLSAQAVRIFAPIPGTSLVGIEIPNEHRISVRFGDVLPHVEPAPLSLAIGRDVEGVPVTVDLAKMPHLLIGGTTGSGKSVMINSIIMSLLMRTTPAEVRLIMIDPKRVELSGYNGIPHLYVPVVTDPRQAASALQWTVAEMDRRLKILEKVGAKNIGIFNRMVQDGKFADREEPVEEMPLLVLIIDELSDLMMVAGKDVESSIIRISQLGRAPGIHLVVATQRPAAEIVTNAIKVNITERIAFSVATSTDSRVILDQTGAEKLIGMGDMLFSRAIWGKPKRVQGCFVTDDEINAVVEHLKSQGDPEYHTEILSTVLPSSAAGASGGSEGGGADDELVWEAADIVINMGFASTSGLQRKLSVGYARAGRIMDILEQKGVVGPANGSKPRDVLVDHSDLEAIKAFERQDREAEGL